MVHVNLLAICCWSYCSGTKGEGCGVGQLKGGGMVGGRQGAAITDSGYTEGMMSLSLKPLAKGLLSILS